ncbi:MAG: hypothetical protein AB7I38_12890 [Dehalococcoidia bacterium]
MGVIATVEGDSMVSAPDDRGGPRSTLVDPASPTAHVRPTDYAASTLDRTMTRDVEGG